ncbi:MAG TPA: DUF2231 domain-containing protein [Dongiaceae bacterium]|jgi:uncharacterized membrane protein
MTDTSWAARAVRPPVHPTIACFPIACFVGVLLTDIAYWRTAEMLWTDFSAWLVSAGVILGWLAAIGGVVDLFGHRYDGGPAPAWVYAAGNFIALVLATINMLVHTRDAWTSVVPWGLALSAATVVVLILTMWIGWATLYRRDARVSPNVRVVS